MRNRELVLSSIQQHPNVTRSQIAELLGLPRTTVTAAVASLVSDGRVEENPTRPTHRRGRPAMLLRASEAVRLVAAVIVHRHHVRVTLHDSDAKQWGSGRRSLAQLAEGSVLPVARALLDELLAEVRTPLTPVLERVVVGVPCFPDPEGQISMTTLVEEALSDRTRAGVLGEAHRPALVAYHASLAALGEFEFGAARRNPEFVYLKCSRNSIGAAVVMNGTVRRSGRELTGSIAHLHVEEDGPPCLCGRRGCLGSVLGPTRAEIPRQRDSEDVTSDEAHGDDRPLSRRGRRALGTTLGRLLAPTCAILEPQAIVIDSALRPFDDEIRRAMTATLRDHAGPAAVRGLEIITGALPDAESAGATALSRRAAI
ncbi:ROK family transcriptional regulator [Pseudonocardia sp. ICBG1142]|uniref:ROK family transcriptional regulator n=1 Tax=Pseudonocardia sp. ICBG1142 TaxID=2846760 RepID=UPI001CF67BF9|nr:ROK family transcriptional regulator [Pseudonocardia sp. ICBG1142]